MSTLELTNLRVLVQPIVASFGHLANKRCVADDPFCPHDSHFGQLDRDWKAAGHFGGELDSLLKFVACHGYHSERW